MVTVITHFIESYNLRITSSCIIDNVSTLSFLALTSLACDSSGFKLLALSNKSVVSVNRSQL